MKRNKNNENLKLNLKLKIISESKDYLAVVVSIRTLALAVDERGRLDWILWREAKALEDDVEGLGEAHEEDEEDDAKLGQVLGHHPVDHGHHGAHLEKTKSVREKT
jgi:hypothetical protein